MSTEKRLTVNEHGDPVLTIKIVGHHDIYRITHVLERAQTDFCSVARRIRRSHKRLLGRRWASLDDYYTGKAWERHG